MAEGRLDVLSAGGVISNYLALGAGRAFLINDIEIATAQLWVRPDQGVRTFADLKGRRVATTTKTTAHIFLHRALRANNIDPSDVELVNGRMTDAVASFIAGTVPAVALWVPFNIRVREALPDAIKLVDASAFYPSPPSSAGGSREPTTTTTTRRSSATSSALGRTPTITSSATPLLRPKRCRRTTTGRRRCPILPKR